MSATENKQLTIQTDGLLKANKNDIGAIVTKFGNDVRNGNIDPYEALILLKKMEYMVKQGLEIVKPIADGKELQKGGYNLYNTEITESMQGVKWDYENCGDNEMNLLLDQQKALKVKFEERSKFLQGITKDLEIVDTDSGETYTIHPPVKSGSLGKTVKLK